LAAPRSLIVLLVAAAALALAALPARALAAHDNYETALQINQPGTQLPEFTTIGGDGTESNIGYSLQQQLPGGIPEPDTCGSSAFGATAWYELHPDVPGTVFVDVKGDESPPPNPFDATLAFVPYNRSSGVPDVGAADCIDDQLGTSPETISYDVARGGSYKVQVGGYDDGQGPDQNYYQADFTFLRNTDGDGKYDFEDACPTVAGDLANGCPSTPPPPPRPDVDGDGVFDDGPDQCLGENSRARDANTNGCLDLATFSPTWIFDPGTFFVRRGGRIVLLGVTVERFGVTGVPKGARVVVTCTRRACPRMAKRANSTVIFRQLKGEKLRAGVKVIVRVTKPGYVGRARVYTIKKNDLSVKNRCLLPGTRRLRRGCSPVR
jgi:hypothetical protein